MPRNVDPGQILVGKGRAPQGTVEDNSLRNPNRDVQPLRAHIHDPSRAHFAVAIALEDVAGNFVSDNVEGALAEIAGATSLGRANGLLSGGTYVLSGASPTTLTLDATNVLVNGTDADFSGAAVNLTDGATNYIYVDPGTAALTVVTGTPPALSSEPVLISRVVIDGGGTVTSESDARWFVLNVDRKPPLTVRSSGVAGNRNSEANFETLESALFYLGEYASAGSSAMETHRVIVRGNIDVASNYALPALDGIIFEGDGEGQFTSTAAFAGSFFTIASDRVQFRNLSFVCDHASLTAIDGIGNDIRIEDCDFQEGASQFAAGISLTLSARSVVRNCRVTASSDGILLDGGSNNRVEDCFVKGNAGTGGNGIAFFSGVVPATAGDGNNIVRGCTVSGYALAVYMRGDNDVITDCFFEDCSRGIDHPLPGGAGGGDGNLRIDNVTVTLDPLTGVNGIEINTPNFRVSNCRIQNARTVWATQQPRGIEVTGGSDAGSISNCEIEGFFNPSNGQGVGIEISGDWVVVESNRIIIPDDGTTTPSTTIGVSYTSLSTDALIQGNVISGPATGVQAVGDRNRFLGNLITLSADTGRFGISTAADDGVIADNFISNPRLESAYTTEFIVGIYAQGPRQRIHNNRVSGFYNQPDGSGRAIYVTGTASETQVTNNIVSAAHTGIEVLELNCLVEGNRVDDTLQGISLGSGASGTKVLNNTVVSDTTAGIVGILVTDCTDWVVRGNTVNGSSSAPLGISVVSTGTSMRDWAIQDNFVDATDGGAGIRVVDLVKDGVITGNVVDNYLTGDPNNPTSAGIEVLGVASIPSDIVISNNDVQRSTRGIVVSGDLARRPSMITITGNLVHHCAEALNIAVAGNTFDEWPCGIGLNHVDEALVEGNTINKIGILINDANAEVFPDQGLPVDDSRSMAVSLWNCSRAQVRGNQIINSVSNNGNSLGLVLYQLDSGVGPGIPFNTQDHVIADNVLSWDAAGLPGDGEAERGVYVLMARGTDDPTSDHSMTNLKIEGNTTNLNGRWGVQAIAGEGSTLSNLSILNNTVNDPATVGGSLTGGIAVELFSGGGTADPGVIRNVSVSGNIIRNSVGNGLAFRFGRTGSVTGVRVSDNTIDNTTRHAIRVETLTASTVVTMDDWAIEDNTVTEWGLIAGAFSGLSFSDALSLTGAVSRWSLSRNRFICGSTGTNIGPAIDIATTDRALYYWDIADNYVNHPSSSDLSSYYQDRGVSVVITYSVAAAPAGLFDFRVLRNAIYTENAATLFFDVAGAAETLALQGNILHHDSVGTVAASFDFNNPVAPPPAFYNTFIVQDNVIRGGLGTLFTVDGGPGISNTKITGNTFQDSSDYGLQFDVIDSADQTYASQDLLIDGNVFQDCDQQGLLLNLGANGSFASQAFVNTRVTNNSFQRCGLNVGAATPSALEVAMWGQLRSASFSHNSFQQCAGSEDADTHGSVRLRIVSNGAVAAEAIQIDGNTMEQCGGVGVRVDESAAGGTNTSLRSLSISGNRISDQTNTGIYLDLSNFQDGVEGISISNNSISNILTGSTASNKGVFVTGPTAQIIESLAVNGNNFNGVDAATPAGQGCISLVAPEDFLNLSASGNSIEGSGAAGIYVRSEGLMEGVAFNNNVITNVVGTSIAAYAAGTDNPSAIRSLSVVGNSINGGGTGGGIYVQVNDVTINADIDGATISSNTIRDVVAAGIHVDAGDLASALPVNALSIVGNTVETTAGNGIYCDGLAGDWTSVMISGNTVDDSSGTGIRVVTTSGDLRDVSVVGNVISNVADEGIAMATSSGNRLETKIDSNAITAWGANSSNINQIGGIRVVTLTGGQCYGFACNGNTLRSPTRDYVTGLWFEEAATLTQVWNCQNNEVFLGGTPLGTISMELDTNATTGQLQLAITGNNFRNALTGVTLSGSANPDRSIVSHNIERTSGGGGNWAVFATGFGANSIKDRNQD